MSCRIETNANHITVAGVVSLSELRRLTATLHNLTFKLGYSDVVLDFSRCSAALPGPMVGLAAQVANLRSREIDVQLVLPSDPKLARLFLGANWGHVMDPTRHKRSAYRGYTHVPISSFHSLEEQSQTVNRMIDALLCSVPGVDRTDLAAIEWSLNEVIDNVLVHAQSSVGGYAQLNTFRINKRVQFCVADAGAGIPGTLRPRFPNLEDIELLEQAIKEGVTRDPALGQGNGLYGTFQVSRTSSGYMYILSGFATLSYEKEQLRITRERIPYMGTLVVASMDCSNPTALGDALKFGETAARLTDYIDLHFEDQSSDELVFRMAEETVSCGSRVAGTPVRTKLLNLVHMNPGRRVVVDMSDVPLVSSSFADEVFGKLFTTLGPLRFMKSMEIRGVVSTVRALVDRAIMQRSQNPVAGVGE